MFCIFSCWLDHDDGSCTAISCGFMLASVVCHACVERTGGGVGRLWEYLVVSAALFESVRLFYGSVCAVYVPHVFLD